MSKKKGVRHCKYSQTPKYDNTIVVRINAFQALQLEEICKEYNTTKTAIVRLALNKLIEMIDSNN